jgi:hypothetical protein
MGQPSQAIRSQQGNPLMDTPRSATFGPSLFRAFVHAPARRLAAGLLSAGLLLASLLPPSAAPALAAATPTQITASLTDGTLLATFSSASNLSLSDPCSITLKVDSSPNDMLAQWYAQVNMARAISTVRPVSIPKKDLLLRYYTGTPGSVAATASLSNAWPSKLWATVLPTAVYVTFLCNSARASVQSTTTISGPADVPVGSTVTFTAVVSPKVVVSSAQAVSGDVRFGIVSPFGLTTLCLDQAVPPQGLNLVATCTTSRLPAGFDLIVAAFSPDSASMLQASSSAPRGVLVH